MRIGIGIDTGGTYTDAVAYDFDTRTILGSAKALTTRRDLSVGIMEALDNLSGEWLAKPELVSLSTTLATNACVENKIGRAKLMFFGGDAATVNRYGGEYGLPSAEEIYLQESHTTFSGKLEREVDWEYFLAQAPGWIGDVDGVGIIEMNAARNGAVVEKRARDLLAGKTAIPIVCGHELSTELSCLQRGASTLLNAALFPIIKNFIAAIRKAMARRGIAAPVVIVRSDGSVMSEEFAALRPVETLLCGPAASVMGGVELAGGGDSVVVDMGGTTTDIAVVKDGVPLRAENGIGVGKWKTFVRGLYINTVGLGGDSAVHYRDGELVLEPYRVVPLCVAAAAHPSLIGQLEEQVAAFARHTRYLHEFFVLVRDIAGSGRYTDEERRFCAALMAGPLIRKKAAAAVGRDEYTLDVSRLLREGVVQVCGLTPTDVMHIRGDFARYRNDASRLGAAFVAANLDISVEELCERVYDEVRRKLYLNVVKALLENENREYRQNGIDPSVEKLICESYSRARAGGRDAFIAPGFRTDFSLIGVGAPIHIFLPEVARLLGTRAMVPEHSGVANALGAIVGKIHARREILVRPSYTTEGVIGYTVLGEDERTQFESRQEAEAHALGEARDGARKEALRRGAVGEVALTCELEAQDVPTREGTIYLGSRAVAHAVGSAGL